MADKLQRISIGFHGQAVATRVGFERLSALRTALEKGESGWHELATEDGLLVLDLAKVVYMHIDTSDQRVGFGA
jgi:hypothetical protein